MAVLVGLGATACETHEDSRDPAPGVDAAPAAASADDAARMAPPPPSALQAQLADDERALIARLPAGPGHDLLVANCLSCHSPHMITQQRKDTAGWSKTVTTMVAWGAPLPPAQQGVLVQYLAAQYPAGVAGAPPPPAP